MGKKVQTNRGLVWVLVAALGIGAISLLFPDSASRFSSIVDNRMQSVVKITVPREEGGVGGAGVLISKYGHILTVAHLFKMAHSTPQIQGLNAATTFYAEVLYVDTDDDIALLKIDSFTPNYAPIARLGGVKIGEEVIVIGHPLGLDWSVSHGIISQLRQNCLYTQFNQTDAAMNPGNSGGPVFNLDGEVIGIASHGYALSIFPVDSGLNMAVSVYSIHKMLNKFRGL